MLTKSLIGAICACLAVITFSADAALIGRLAATAGGTDYQAYYDDVADITWLADANYAQTSGYTGTGVFSNGLMTWDEATTWAAGLTVEGVSGWRLPTLLDIINPCFGFNCTDSEMGHLYNVVGITPSTPGPFSNVQNYIYYTDTYSPTGFGQFEEVHIFWFNGGFQGYDLQNSGFHAWAVKSGDVSAVPVPAAVWLFGSGLLGLIGIARRKKA